MQAYDDFGNEVFPVTIHTIAPLAFATDARYISATFLWANGGVDDVASEMLPVQLGLIGTGIPTHIYCARNSYTHELANQLAFLSAREELWISGELETEPSTILVKFCTFDCPLETLGLEVI